MTDPKDGRAKRILLRKEHNAKTKEHNNKHRPGSNEWLPMGCGNGRGCHICRRGRKSLRKVKGNRKNYPKRKYGNFSNFPEDETTTFGDGDYFEEHDTDGYDENGMYYEYSDHYGMYYSHVVFNGVFYRGFCRPWPDW